MDEMSPETAQAPAPVQMPAPEAPAAPVPAAQPAAPAPAAAKAKRPFSWRFAILAGAASAIVAVAVTIGVILVLQATGNRPFAGDGDATTLAVLVSLIVTPLLSSLLAFAISAFFARSSMILHAIAAVVLSLLFDVAFGFPAGVIAVALTGPR